MPLRDDWKSVSVLIRQIDPVLRSHSCSADILLIDDDSRQTWGREDFQGTFQAIRTIRTLRLRLNLGHQRALAVGLVDVFLKGQCDGVLVMDADGEDTAEGVSDLLDAFRQEQGTMLIFAQRSRRSESLPFRCFYQGYVLLIRLLTGLKMRVGNFSIVPPGYLNALVVQPELWDHYAASVVRCKRPYRTVPIPRGKRIAGKSRMDFIALAAHGLSAISVFGDRVATRLLVGSMAGLFLALAAALSLVVTRFVAGWVIPGWAIDATRTAIIAMVQFVSMAGIFTALALLKRSNSAFVPLRDCSLFVSEQVQIYPD
jgi:hypothetical protein